MYERPYVKSLICIYYFIMAADPEILPSETFNQTVITYAFSKIFL